MSRIFTGFLLSIIFFSCGKKFVENEDEKYLELNKAEIKALNEKNGLGLTEHVATGIFWKKLVEQPNPKYATNDVTVHLAYKLSTISGSVLFNVTPADSNFFGANSVGSVFQGFTIAVNSLGEGEKGIFYLPSTLVFGGDPPSNINIKPWEVTILEMEILKHYTEDGLIDLFIAERGLNQPELTEKGVRIFRRENRPETADLVVGDVVNVKYKGYFLSGDVFDEGTIEVVLGAMGVIEGFEDAVLHMKPGEIATVVIPWKLGYGDVASGSIPPRTTLAFDLEIVSKN